MKHISIYKHFDIYFFIDPKKIPSISAYAQNGTMVIYDKFTTLDHYMIYYFGSQIYYSNIQYKYKRSYKM
jgi:hypothetical protein